MIHKQVTGVTELTLARFVVQARRAARLRGTVDVLIASDSELRSLNRRFRGKDKATDVLSFPADDAAANRGFAGDIAISANIAVRNARLLGHSPKTELKVLILHGILHLCGHDHENDGGEMAKIEMRVRERLRLPLGLIERSQSANGGKALRGSGVLRRL